MVSVAGIAFLVSGVPLVSPGERLEGVTVQIGDCVIHGDLAVRSTNERGAGRSEVGCLFFPTSPSEEARWMALLAGLETALGAKG